MGTLEQFKLRLCVYPYFSLDSALRAACPPYDCPIPIPWAIFHPLFLFKPSFARVLPSLAYRYISCLNS